MKNTLLILRSVAGIAAGLLLITVITELIEYLTVKSVSGHSFEYLSANQDEYFAIRNSSFILVFKMFYTGFAMFAGGYVAVWITAKKPMLHAWILIVIQVAALIWGGFYSEFSHTGPVWMWLSLIVLAVAGIYIGAYIRVKSGNTSVQGNAIF